MALDETLVALRDVPGGAAAYVLKPTLLGSRRTLELVELAQTNEVSVVISSAFESAVGRADLVRFAARVAPEAVHGLGTGPAFAEDFEGWIREDGEWLHAQQGTPPSSEEVPWVDC